MDSQNWDMTQVLANTKNAYALNLYIVLYTNNKTKSIMNQLIGPKCVIILVHDFSFVSAHQLEHMRELSQSGACSFN